MRHPHAAAALAALLSFRAELPAWGAEPAAARSVDVDGPGGQLRLAVFADASGRLSYRVTFRQQPVIEASPLGIVVDRVDLGQGVALGAVERYQHEERYPWRGVHAEAVDRHRGARIAVTHRASGTAYVVEVRAFDDGVGFRHVVAGPADARRTPEAGIGFALPKGSVVWYHGLNGHYEGLYTRKAIEELPAGEWAGPPVTVRLPGGLGYASLTEAGLRDYSGMVLQADGAGFRERLGHEPPPSYPYTLRYGQQEAARLSKPAAIAGTITTPWRVVLVGADLDALVNSDILPNLTASADPQLFPDGIRTSWLRPGRSVWRYLDGGAQGLEGMREFSRLAGELGFEYNLIEGFWRRWTDAELRELVAYSAERKVRLILWIHSRELREPAARRALLDRVAAAGAAGVKVDFLDHEAREVIDVYHAVLRDAAERRLIVNFHGANKPTGEPRLWPNELTREGILGLEHGRGESWAAFNTTMPFARLLAGHADYTPVVFGERRKETSWAHQIATAAVLTSPLLVYGAHPRTLLEHPAADMIRSIPSVWDQTLVMPVSEVGEVAAFARRSGERWFLAVLNGPTARTVRIGLSFLGQGQRKGLLVRDRAEQAAAVAIEQRPVSGAETLEIVLRAGGGFIGRFTP